MTHSCTPGAHGREHQRQCLQRKDDDEQTISDPIATFTFLQKIIIKTIF